MCSQPLKSSFASLCQGIFCCHSLLLFLNQRVCDCCSVSTCIFSFMVYLSMRKICNFGFLFPMICKGSINLITFIYLTENYRNSIYSSFLISIGSSTNVRSVSCLYCESIFPWISLTSILISSIDFLIEGVVTSMFHVIEPTTKNIIRTDNMQLNEL